MSWFRVLVLAFLCPCIDVNGHLINVLKNGSLPANDTGTYYQIDLELYGFSVLTSSNCLSFGIGGFASASDQIHRIGGTKVVVASNHLIPVQYEYEGEITLDQCGQIASKANHSVIGFSWGTNFEIPSKVVPASSDGSTIGTFEHHFQKVKKDRFGCIIYVSSYDDSEPSALFDCGGSADLCQLLNFTPVLKLPGDPSVANTICCQQQLSNFGQEFFSRTVTGFWIAYRPQTHFALDCDNEDVAVTKPVEKTVLFWGELIAFYALTFLFSTVPVIIFKSSKGEDVLVTTGPRMFAFQYNKLWACLYYGSFVEGLTSVMGMPSWYCQAFKLAVTMLTSFLLNDLPVKILKWFLAGRAEVALATVLGFAAGFYCYMMEDIAYDPLYVKLIGHHPLILGFVAYFGKLGSRVILNMMWFQCFQFKQGIVPLCDKGSFDTHDVIYVPVATDLALDSLSLPNA